MINYFGMESSMNYVSTELSKKKQKENRIMLEKFFKLQENHTTVKTEIIAGFTTFMTMAYILAVNPNILSAAGMNPQAVLPRIFLWRTWQRGLLLPMRMGRRFM